MEVQYTAVRIVWKLYLDFLLFINPLV